MSWDESVGVCNGQLEVMLPPYTNLHGVLTVLPPTPVGGDPPSFVRVARVSLLTVDQKVLFLLRHCVRWLIKSPTRLRMPFA